MKALLYVLCVGVIIQSVGILIFGASNHMPTETIIGIMVISLLPLVKLNMSFSFIHGWAIQKLEGKKIAGGLPFWVWGVIALLVVISCALIILGMSTPWGTDVGIMMVGGGFLFATFWGVVMWFLCWKDGAQFYSEYEARVYFYKLGLPQNHISKEISRLRMKGLLTIVNVKE